MFPARRLLLALIALCSFIDIYLLLLMVVAAGAGDAQNMIWAFGAVECGIIASAILSLAFCVPKRLRQGIDRAWRGGKRAVAHVNARPAHPPA